jgi:hypothetical protein
MVTMRRLIFPIGVAILAGCLASKPIAQEPIPNLSVCSAEGGTCNSPTGRVGEARYDYQQIVRREHVFSN